MRYQVRERIGDKGGFGDVFKCISDAGDEYAIKLLKENNKNTILRFQKEIRLTSRLSHPNIIQVVDYRATGEQLFYLMPLYKCSLATVIPDLYDVPERQYKIITELLSGVIYLHSEGVLHRDLKPQNILYNSDTDIAITDLGFSRQIDSRSDRLTVIGAGFGTERYVSPEQWADASEVDEKTDIYAIGKILEDIVTGNRRYSIPSAELEYLINQCTDKNPSKRFSTASELKTVIDSIYLKWLGIVEQTDIDELLAQLNVEQLSMQQILELGFQLMPLDDDDRIVAFFQSIPEDAFQYLEQVNKELLISLIVKLRDFFISQGWSFGYTDTIGRICYKLYTLSENSIIKANLLYTIIEVGLSHNRFYVMGLASRLLVDIKSDAVQGFELARLFSEIRELDINRLNITQDRLPMCLQKYFRNDEAVEELFDVLF